MGIINGIAAIGRAIIDAAKNFWNKLTGVLRSFWESFHNKVKKFIQKVEARIQRKVLGVLTYLKKGIDGMITRITRNFVEINGTYKEVEVESKPIPPEEVPPEFLEKMQNGNTVNISDDYEQLLTA